MDPKRFTEWLGTLEGVAKTATTCIAVLATLSDKVNHWLLDVLKLLGIRSPWAAPVVNLLIVVACVLLLWRSFRRFNRASRLEQPDAFTLHPTTPATLIGRDADLSKLLNSVKQHRLVLLDGESGCGKSALIQAGLIPLLKEEGGLLPVAIREWGDDWVRGPLADALDAMFHALSPADRDRLGWHSPPDLAASTAALEADFDTHLAALLGILGRRALLVADQFDDYQARHRRRFLDEEGNWLTPTALAATNPFWHLVSEGLNAGRLHLLVVTRSDTAAGLACVRFLGEGPTATRTLARVEAEYLHPLLAGIVADDGAAVVVSHPEGGWQALRERIERDLRTEGAILMQQVRTVMLGLRQLPLLTPKHYTAAGGLRGVETLVISRALRRAGTAAGGGAEGRRVAGAVLGELVLPGGRDQLPKARRASLSHLYGIVHDKGRTEAILGALQHDEVVRPAEAVGSESAWQLDHDYLARAVLAEARQADRWTIALREGKRLYDDAAGDWRGRYAALLPLTTLMRLCWERARNRLRFGAAAPYALVSAVKPGALTLCLGLVVAGTYAWAHDRQLTVEAYQRINGFATNDKAKEVLRVWRAPPALRSRILALLQADAEQLRLAVNAGWHWAHAGAVPAGARELSAAFSRRLARENNPEIDVYLFLGTYIGVLARVQDADQIKAEAAMFRARIGRQPEDSITLGLANAYAAACAQSNDEAAIRAALADLRSWMEHARQGASAYRLQEDYKMLTERLKDTADVKAELKALRPLLAQPRPAATASALLESYMAAAARLSNAADLKAEAAALRGLFVQERDAARASTLAAYRAMLARLDDKAELRAAVTVLRTRLAQEANEDAARGIAAAYAAAAARLGDAAELANAAVILRTRWQQRLERRGYLEPRQGMSLEEREETYANAAHLSGLEQDYAAVAAHLAPAAAKSEAAALRDLLNKEDNAGVSEAFVVTYATVAARLDAAALREEVAILRGGLGLEEKGSIYQYGAPAPNYLLRAYSSVVRHLQAPADVKTEAEALRTRLEQEKNANIAGDVAQAYEAVAARLNEPDDIKAEVTNLRARLAPKHFSEPNNIEKAYIAMAARLRREADVKAEADALRTLLARTQYADAINIMRVYPDLAAKLDNASNIKDEMVALRLLLEQNMAKNVVDTFRHAYASLAARLNDTAELQAGAEFLRRQLEQAGHNDSFFIAQDYAAVVARLDDPVLVERTVGLLRVLMKQSPGLANQLYMPFGTLASRLRNAADLKAAAVFLRSWLPKGSKENGIPYQTASSLVEAYRLVAARLDDAADVKAEATALRKVLEQGVAEETAQAYQAVAVKLHGMADLKHEADALRMQLEAAGRADDVLTLARSYAAVSGAMVKRENASGCPALTAEILTLAGHPFLREPDDLLRLLAPASGTSFGKDLRSAVRWAVHTCRLRPEELRPPPTSS